MLCHYFPSVHNLQKYNHSNEKISSCNWSSPWLQREPGNTQRRRGLVAGRPLIPSKAAFSTECNIVVFVKYKSINNIYFGNEDGSTPGSDKAEARQFCLGIFQNSHSLVPLFLSVDPQQSSEVGSLRHTQVSVRTPWQVESGVQGQVTLGPTISTGSRSQTSSPSSSGPSRIPAAVTGPPTASHRCRHLRAEPPSWASTASVSWPPGSSSAPSSGPETSRTSQSCPFQSRSALRIHLEVSSFLCISHFENQVRVKVQIAF